MGGRNTARRIAASPVSLLPVARPSLPVADAVLPYLRQMDEARWYSNFGPLLTAFEARLTQRFSGGTHVVTCANATQGLTLTLQAMNLPPGSLCVVPAYTFVATAHAVAAAGLVPLFLDVDADSWMLDPATVRAALGGQAIACVVPVAPFGAMPDLEGWNAFRRETGISVLIDAAAAFDRAVLAPLPMVVSLHATKVLGVGEGGFLATQDEALAERVRLLTTFGFKDSRLSQVPATNAKLSEYPAAVGLAALDAWPHDRLRWMRAAQLMRAALTHLPQVRFQPGWGVDWVTSVCCVALPEGSVAAVEAAMTEQGVQTRRWWGGGCVEGPAFAGCPRGDLPNTDRLSGSVLGLPFAIDMDSGQISRVATALEQALGGFPQCGPQSRP